MRTRPLLVALAALVALLLAPAGACAHAQLVASVPADGSAVAVPPTELRVSFSEPVLPRFTRLVLRTAAGAVVGSVEGAHLVGIAGATTTIAIALPRLPDGSYRAVVGVESAGDLHWVRSTIAFAIGANATAPPPANPGGYAPEPRPRVVETLARWVAFGAIALLCGLLALALIVPARGASLRRTALGAVIVGVVASTSVLVAELAAAGAGLDGLRGTLTGTGLGRSVLAQVLLLTLAAVCVRNARHRDGLVLATGAAAAAALGSHAVAIDLLAGLALAAHLGAAALWAGIVFAIVLAVLPGLRGSGDERMAIGAALRRIGPIAGAAAGVTAITGVYSLGRHVATIDALVTSRYGVTALVKSGLVLLALVLAAAANRLVRGGRLARLGRVVPIEAVALLLVLLAAAAMAAGAPATGPRYVGRALPSPSTSATARVADLDVTFAVRPNATGRNDVTVQVVQTSVPVLGAVAAVAVSVDNGAPVIATPAGSDRWRARAVPFVRTGPVRLAASIDRVGLRRRTAAVDWRVAGGPSTTPVRTEVSDASLTPTTTVLAVLGAIALGAALGRGRRRVASTESR
jgi:copper transport protein